MSLTPEQREEIRESVLEFFDGNRERADLWWRTPNPQFAGLRPAMMAVWDEDSLYRWVMDSVAENPRKVGP